MKEDIPSLQDTVLCRNDVKGKWLSDTILPSYIHTVLYPCLGESEDFNKPKIVWGEISDRSKFAFEAYGSFIPEATTFLMVGSDLPYLLCVLNSPLSEWFFSKVGTTTGVGTVRWKKYTIQELLIPSVNVKLRQLFQQIVEKYVTGNITSEQLSKYSNKILYEVVGLIDEEIEFVENFYPPLI